MAQLSLQLPQLLLHDAAEVVQVFRHPKLDDISELRVDPALNFFELFLLFEGGKVELVFFFFFSFGFVGKEGFPAEPGFFFLGFF